MSEVPSRRPIHLSLTRPLLLAGAEPPFAIFEATVIAILLIAVGIHLLTVGLVGFYLLVFHPLAVWASTKDPQVIEVYARSLRYADFYPATAGVRARSISVAPAVARR